eukprot:8766635-Alexandrium_andersonii.AAC.1
MWSASSDNYFVVAVLPVWPFIQNTLRRRVWKKLEQWRRESPSRAPKSEAEPTWVVQPVVQTRIAVIAPCSLGARSNPPQKWCRAIASGPRPPQPARGVFRTVPQGYRWPERGIPTRGPDLGEAGDESCAQFRIAAGVWQSSVHPCS